MTYPLTKMRRMPAGTGYHSCSNLVYLLEPGRGRTSAQLMLGGSHTDSAQNQCGLESDVVIANLINLKIKKRFHSISFSAFKTFYCASLSLSASSSAPVVLFMA